MYKRQASKQTPNPTKGRFTKFPARLRRSIMTKVLPAKPIMMLIKKTLGPITVKLPKWILRSALMPPMAMA